MNFDDLEKTWAQQTVAGSPVPVAELRKQLVREVRQRSGRMRRIIGVATFAFVTGWAVALVAHVTGIRPFNAVTLTGFVVVSLFDLTCLAVAWRSLRAMQREALGMGESLVESLSVSLRTVDWQIRDCIRLGYAVIVALIGSVTLAVVHHATGNLPLRGVIAEVALSSITAAAIGATVRRYYRHQLLPRREELRQQLSQLQ
jgi:hypothetical protein